MIMESQPGHIDQIKQTNAGVVYRLIDRFGPISRIELARKAQLAPASITKIVREMLEAHLVQETEFQEPGSRGRPAIGLILDTVAWHYLSVRIGNGEITLALRDLSSSLVVEESRPLPPGDAQPLSERIITEINHFFVRHQQRLERLTAIAITLPGILNSVQGIVHSIPLYPDKDMPLGPELEKCTGLPVYLQHDINAWLMAEVLFGAARDATEVIQVVIDNHVGAAVVTGGHLLHGDGIRRVEIGHTQVDPYGKPCYCGNHGCLETVASCESMLDMAAQRLRAADSSLLHQQSLTVDSLCDAALAGDRLARDIIIDVGHSVGRVLALMVNLFNPQKILIGSPLNRASDILHPAISESVRRQAFQAYSADTEVLPTFFQNQGTLPGAALIKDALYNGTLLIKLLQG
ncbi:MULTISPECIES: sugar metabolism global transcriptional regulator Mlc [Erwinia]|uniref:Transcriptional regulator n=2 Tax=Erwinia TaxID=551 RepID=A0A014N9H6_9GAMM|nr:ROK family transcriptional regulator [Erwinia mallotivora]EXU76058.1 transcriptional regulator [Erwinia mallotivora]